MILLDLLAKGISQSTSVTCLDGVYSLVASALIDILESFKLFHFGHVKQ